MSLCGSFEQLKLQERVSRLYTNVRSATLRRLVHIPRKFLGSTEVTGGQPTYLTRVSGNSNSSSDSSSFLFCGNYGSDYWKRKYEKLGK